MNKILKKFEKLVFLFLLFLSILLIAFYLINFENFWYFQFGDRDLLRSIYLFNDFQLYGPELNHLNGLRSIGGFLYYYIYLLQLITNKIQYIFLLSLFFNNIYP